LPLPYFVGIPDIEPIVEEQKQIGAHGQAQGGLEC
jgi:hypothetical protein